MIRLSSMLVVTMTVIYLTPFTLAQYSEPLPPPDQFAQPEPAQRLPTPMQSQSKRLSNGPLENWTPPLSQGYTPDVSVRIKDITSIAGDRSNLLQGLGLVIGLKGTGGKSLTTREANRNLLQNFDLLSNVPATGNTSVVMVSAEIPASATAGEIISATVSVVDDATSLYGGQLLLTPLEGVDGEVYAVAGGSLVVGGFSVEGNAGSLSKNHDTVAKVDATVELELKQGPAFPGTSFRLLLKNKDYATAHRIATEINRYFRGHARALDQGTVEVFFPQTYFNSKMDFVVMINEMRVVPDNEARVVINQRTGTIVVGQNVRLSKLMVANGNLIITTNETPLASQPAPFSDGQTVVLPRTQLSATETGSRYNIINPQTTVGDLAAALNTLGVSPQDLINIFHDIDAQGALQGKLIIQ
jgi:flagellar P-ring protein precursor FlgI